MTLVVRQKTLAAKLVAESFKLVDSLALEADSGNS